MAYTITSQKYPPRGPRKPTLTVVADSLEDLNELTNAANGSTADVGGTTYIMDDGVWGDGSGGGGGLDFEGYVLSQFTMNKADSILTLTDSVGVPKYWIVDAQSLHFSSDSNVFDGDEPYDIAGFEWSTDMGSSFPPNYPMFIIPGDSAKVEVARYFTPDNFSAVSPDSNGIVSLLNQNNVVAIRISAK